MACPFFYPIEPFDDKRWNPRPQLPLGNPYEGECRAAAGPCRPNEQELKTLCNMGYARSKCARFPLDCRVDAVRFMVNQDNGQTVVISFVQEYEHRPADYGKLEYSAAARQFVSPHPDPVVNQQAAAYVRAYLQRKAAPAAAGGPSRC